ncbi:hypothetical protein GCM10027043_30790 [Ferruginibacter profundus]
MAQTDAVPVFKGAIKANREKLYNSIIKNSITQNLSLPLSDSTEADWEDAFSAMELINYRQPWVNEKIKTAFTGIEKRSAEFQRALMELVYTNYTTEFKSNINSLFSKTTYAKVFAMCTEYLLRADKSRNNIESIASIVYNKNPEDFDNAEMASEIQFEILWPIMQLAEKESSKIKLKPAVLLNNNFLKNNIVVYSIQRKNRNYPGLVVVRDKNGKFIRDDTGIIFSVPQLARSITNMPGYLTNGNTPQGIFRMYGFAVSKSPALGPTENLQLTMPFETTVQHFLKDSSITDTVWTPELYERLLPAGLKKYHPIFGTFYASAIGRTEIIAHGTTVDPEYYKGQTYYPYTPTAGCLATKEIWSAIDGKRTISDQQKLVDAIKKAGGADGYIIVFEIDDQQKPVSINEVLPYLKARQ